MSTSGTNDKEFRKKPMLTPGDRVQSKLNPFETGEVCCVSLVSNTCRVIMDEECVVEGEPMVRCYFITELIKEEK